jgi:hypothetical protein
MNKGNINLEDLTVTALKEMAKAQGVVGYSTMRKAELIDSIDNIRTNPSTRNVQKMQMTSSHRGTYMVLCEKSGTNGEYYASIRPDPDLSKRVKIGQVNVGDVAEIGKEVHGCYELIQFNKVVGYVIKEYLDYTYEMTRSTTFGGPTCRQVLKTALCWRATNSSPDIFTLHVPVTF